MEVQEHLNIMKKFQKILLNFIENNDEDLHPLIKFINSRNLLSNPQTIYDIINLILKITENHHREINFFNKIISFFQEFLSDFQSAFNKLDILDTFETNKLLLLHLIQNKVILLDESLIQKIINNSQNGSLQLRYFLYSEIQTKIEKDKKDQIEEVISQILKTHDLNIDSFYKNIKEGENEAYICSLIRSDSIEEFVSYVNRTNYPISDGKIQNSIFETNLFLANQNPSLIQYSAFFGSIQIFHYLRLNGVSISPSIWPYAIHGRNADIIHLLEENIKEDISYKFETYRNEAIKCHHNDIAHYIEESLINHKNTNDYEIIFKSHNYEFLPNYLYNFSNEFKFESNFNAFKYLQSIQTVTFPQLAEVIHDNAFVGFRSLTEITIPSTVASIGNNAFKNCSSLKTINFSEPESIRSIGSFAFSCCSSLTMFSVPCTVTEIGCYAFYECFSLAKLIIPSSVTSIKHNAFEGCRSLSEVTIPSSVALIDNYVFYGCSSLRRIEIPSSVTKIGNFAFANCSSLDGVVIPSSVTEIGNNSFYGCSSLTEISVPSSVKLIKKYAFSNCPLLTKVSIPNSIKAIGNYSFYGCKSIVLSDEMDKIPDNLLSGCSSLMQISIPPSITSIGNYAFSGCSSLTEISIPLSVTSIGRHAFDQCSSLTKISIPSSLDLDGMFFDPDIKIIKV